MAAEVRRPRKIEQPDIGCTQFEVVNNDEYCGKIFIQRGGTKTPAHSHLRKHETFLVWSGRLRMMVDGEELMMEPGEVISVDRGTVHEFEALDTDVVLFEFSTSSTPKDSHFSDEADWGKVNRRLPETEDYPWPF